MSLFKRHIARRVAAVGVGVGLLVLGLEAPAFAAPIVSAISPTSGPVNCVVAITGTGFDQPGAFAVATVRFTGATTIDQDDAIFHVVSDTEIWTTVPAAAADGPITITDGNGVTGSSGVFDVTTPAAGNCAPTIASFAPTCGLVGTVVTITGTNLLKSSGDDGPPVVARVGGEVRFNNYTSTAIHTGAAESPTTLSVNVPASAVDGPIRVTTVATTPDSTVTSTATFDVVTDPALCPGAVGAKHARSITLSLRKHLVARGKVSSTEEPAFTDCAASVPVKIQRRRAGGWKTVGSTTTSDTGAYKKRIKDRPGKYRALAPKITLNAGADICSRAVSPIRRHRH